MDPFQVRDMELGLGFAGKLKARCIARDTLSHHGTLKIWRYSICLEYSTNIH